MQLHVIYKFEIYCLCLSTFLSYFSAFLNKNWNSEEMGKNSVIIAIWLIWCWKCNRSCVRRYSCWCCLALSSPALALYSIVTSATNRWFFYVINANGCAFAAAILPLLLLRSFIIFIDRALSTPGPPNTLSGAFVISQKTFKLFLFNQLS